MESNVAVLLGIIGAALLAMLTANAFLLKSILETISNIDKSNTVLNVKNEHLENRINSTEDFQIEITKRVYKLEQKGKV